MLWFAVFLLVFQLYLAFLVGYLVLLTAASLKSTRFRLTPGQPAHPARFLILIPAHNEERLLPDLLASLNRLDYPKEQYQVHVIADNCTDRTAAVARLGGAYVHFRTDHQRKGKGYALNYLLDHLQQVVPLYDAVVFIDADSIVSKNFLNVMSVHLQRGERVIQAYYAVRDPGPSWAGSLRYAALAVLHYLRPLGRMALGFSAGLKGNGMVFVPEIITRRRWTPSVTEDIEMHMALLLEGERVTFAPGAVVSGEMPDNLASSASQHFRWEQGRKQTARQYIPRLLAAAAREFSASRPRRAFLLLDAVMEFLQPPFSLLTALSLLGLAASLALFALHLAFPTLLASSAFRWLPAINLALIAAVLLGQGLYLFVGLRQVSAPKEVYARLLFAPRLIVWKTWQMLLLLNGREQNSWVRTKRNGG